MNRRRISLVLAATSVLGLSALYWLAPWSRTSQAASAPSGDVAFKGKVLLVSPCNMMTADLLLEKAQVQKIGEHSFLVGRGATDGKMAGWYKGRTVRLQLAQILSITEFDDLKEAKKALESGVGIRFSSPVYMNEASTSPQPLFAPGSGERLQPSAKKP